MLYYVSLPETREGRTSQAPIRFCGRAAVSLSHLLHQLHRQRRT